MIMVTWEEKIISHWNWRCNAQKRFRKSGNGFTAAVELAVHTYTRRYVHNYVCMYIRRHVPNNISKLLPIYLEWYNADYYFYKWERNLSGYDKKFPRVCPWSNETFLKILVVVHLRKSHEFFYWRRSNRATSSKWEGCFWQLFFL